MGSEQLRNYLIFGGLGVTLFLVGGGWGAFVDYRYFLYWKKHGQQDACVGYHAALALKESRRTTLAEVHEKCDQMLNSYYDDPRRPTEFYLGYPDSIWQIARKFDMYPVGYTLNP